MLPVGLYKKPLSPNERKPKTLVDSKPLISVGMSSDLYKAGGRCLYT